MKFFPGIIPGLAAAVFGIGIAFSFPNGHCAETPAGSEDLQLGDRAFARGDYHAAERFYRKALVLLASPLWEKGAEQLCRTYLELGSVSSAEDVLTELKKRRPDRPTDILSGMVLAADGNFADAIRAFERAAGRNGPDKPEAVYQLAGAYLASGNCPEAFRHFAELEKLSSPEYARKGHYGKIYTLIRQGRTDDAATLLKDFPPGDDADNLEMLRRIRAQDVSGFGSLWMRKRKSPADPRPDRLLYEICSGGSALALKKGDRKLAETCLKDAFDFAPDDARRKDVMYRLFNLQSRNDPEAAVETVRRYCKAFPDSTAKALLLIQGGRLLAASGKYEEAVALYGEVIKDRENLLDERRAAAADAAVAAEKGGLADEAEKMFGYLITHSVSPEQKQRSELLFAEFYLRGKKFADAEKLLEQVILQGGKPAEDARTALLSLLMESKQYGKAKNVAQQLLGASDPDLANFGRYQLALLSEKERALPRARTLYLEYIKRAPRGAFSAAAHFSAARIAEELGRPETAAQEYFDFAKKFPADANAAAALFLALRADCLGGKGVTAEKCLALLAEKFPAAQEYKAAKLQLADHLFRTGASDRALALLERRGASPDPEMDPAFSLMAARIQLASGKAARALQTAQAALTAYPGAGQAAELCFLCGNILADMGETSQALGFFRRAEKIRPAGLFGEIVSGRIADCSRTLFSDNDLDKKLIEDALGRYRKLAADAKLPGLRLQSLCKAAICCELMKKDASAIDLYEKTLYFASLLKSDNVSPDPVWCARAAYAGARLSLKRPRPERLVRALRLLKLYEDLALPGTGEDFAALRRELRDSYNRLKSQRKDSR